MRDLFHVVLVALALLSAPQAKAANAEPFARPQRFSSQDLSAFAEARIAALKAGLQLTAEQEKNWPALETALRDSAKGRIARFEEWRDGAPARFDSDPIGAMERRSKNLIARSAELEKLAAAAKPLFETLDEAQKRRFGALVRAAIDERMGRLRRMGRTGQAGFGAGPD